jgi:hypothetical protein
MGARALETDPKRIPTRRIRGTNPSATIFERRVGATIEVGGSPRPIRRTRKWKPSLIDASASARTTHLATNNNRGFVSFFRSEEGSPPG